MSQRGYEFLSLFVFSSDMQTIRTFYGITADISEELIEKYKKGEISPFSSWGQKLERFAELDGQYVRMALQRLGFGYPATIRMLESHGVEQAREYVYTDLRDGELRPLRVEDWIEEHDGQYECLYVSVCNVSNHKLSARRSILVYPQGVWSGVNLVNFAQGKEAMPLLIVRPQ